MQADSRTALEAAGFRAGAEGYEIPLPARGNIAELCVGRHARGPLAERVALIAAPAGGPERSYSFAELERLASQLAAGLARLGVGKGEPVGVFTGQRAETVIIHLALYKLGAVAATLSQLYGPDTLGHIFADCGLRFVFAERALWERTTAGIAGGQALPRPIFLDGDEAVTYERLVATEAAGFQACDTALNDPAILMYTSGSTGLPKGLLHAHRVLFAYMPTVRLFYNLETTRPDLVFWTPADWAWVGGLLDLLLPALAEGQTVLASDIRFTPEEAFALMSRYRVSHIFMTPTGLKRLAEVALPRDRWPLRLSTVCTGGESVPSEVVRWCNQALGAACNEFYGLTEFNHLVGNSSAVFPVKPGSMGRPYPGHRTTIVDESGRELPNGEIGEIVAHESDPALFLGYWGRPGVPDALRLGPWLRTRDLAYRDDEGYFWYQGRNDDLIKSAGYRIGPAEVEDMLVAHPAVAEAAVIGKPDPRRGTVVKAFVRLHANHDPSDALVVELQHHVKTRLAAYKYPREIEFVESFPLTSSGKIRRGELRRRELEKAKQGMSRAGVRVAGSATLPFRRARDGSSLRDWLREAAVSALADAALEPRDIDVLVVAMESDHLALQLSVGALAADEAGLVPKPVFRVEMGGASGAAAVHAAAALIASGAAERVLVLGGEQAASHLAAEEVRLLYGLSFDADLEGFAGAVPANLYALSIAAHAARHGTSESDLAQVAVKNFGNAALNPLAHRRRPVSEAEVLASPAVSLPYKALDCSALSDAAAALVLAAPDALPTPVRPPVRLAGLGSASDHLRLGDRADPGSFAAKRTAAAKAYGQAGVTAPRAEIDVAEVYDAFTGAELQSLEALGLAQPGAAAKSLREGVFARDGRQPVNLSGGLIGQGGAPGATGTAQVAAVARLLEGRYVAGLQPDRPLRLGLAEAHSGIATVCFVTLLAGEGWP